MRAAEEWQKEALCRKEGAPDSFFTGQGQNPTEARGICPECSVRDECLEYAILYGELGFWGGLTEKERRKLPAYNVIRNSLIQEAKSLGLYENRPSIDSLIAEARRASVVEISPQPTPLEELEPPVELLMAEPVPTDYAPAQDLQPIQYPLTG